MKRRSAIAASFLRRVLYARPVSSLGAFRIQALHCPARQMLHRPSRFANFSRCGGKLSHPAKRARLQQPTPRELTGLCAGHSSVSRKMDTISRGTVSKRGIARVRARGESAFILKFYFAAPGPSLAWSSSTLFCASATSCCFSAICVCSFFNMAAPSLSESLLGLERTVCSSSAYLR